MKLSLPRHRPWKILLVKPSALGDIVHTLPVLDELRDLFPDARIDWVVNRSYCDLVEGHPALNRVIPFDRGVFRGGVIGGIGRVAAFGGSLRRERYDIVFDLQGLLRSGLMTLATNARYRIGFAHAREGSAFCYTHRVPVDLASVVHAVERNRAILQWFRASDLAMPAAKFRVPIQPLAAEWANQQLHGLPRPFVMVSVGSRWLTKRWLPEHFAELLHAAQTEFNGSVVFVGSPDEKGLADSVVPSLPGRSLNLVGNSSLAQLGAILQMADVMVANDTGPLHLAAALGVPVVAPYTCTRIDRHGPYLQLQQAVATTVACHGSYLKTCDRMICMDELLPERLKPRLFEVLARCARRTHSA